MIISEHIEGPDVMYIWVQKDHLLFLCRGHTDPEDTFSKPTLAFKDRKPIYRELPFTGKWVKKCPIINSLPELKLSRHVQLKSRLFFSRLKPIKDYEE